MIGNKHYMKRLQLIAAWKLSKNVAAAARMVRFTKARAEFWVQRYKATGSLSDLHRSGRPSKLSASAIAAAQQRVLASQSVRLATNQLKAEGIVDPGISHTTIFRHLQDGAGAVQCKGVIKTPLISAVTAEKRMAFAKHHLRRRTGWSRVLFVDSKYFYVSLKGTKKVWVLSGTRPHCAAAKKGAGLHVYGAFSMAGTAQLVLATGTAGYKFPGAKKGVNALEYQHILLEHLLPAAKRLFKGRSWQLLHDSARPHVASSTKAVLKQHKVQVVAHWPANSPDLNPIENLWSWVQRKVNKAAVTCFAELKAAVFDAWEHIPGSLLQDLANSMDTRLGKVQERRGAYTGY